MLGVSLARKLGLSVAAGLAVCSLPFWSQPVFAFHSSVPAASAERKTLVPCAKKDTDRKMTVIQKAFPVDSRRADVLRSSEIVKVIPEVSQVASGFLHIYSPIPEVAVTINENADPTVRSDMAAAFSRIVPDSLSGASFARASFVGREVVIPVSSGRLVLGTWQGLHIADERRGKGVSKRTGGESLVATLVGSGGGGAETFAYQAKTRGCHLVTSPVLSAAEKTTKKGSEGKDSTGFLLAFAQHTSCSMTINENADPDVRTDMETALNLIVPEAWNQEFFQHTYEGPDDMPAHVKSTLFGAGLLIPCRNGRPLFGTWQGIYLNEHRDAGGWGGGHNRKISVSRVPSPPSDSGMVSVQKSLTVSPPGRGCHVITPDVVAAVGDELSKVESGLLNVFIRHTSASLTVHPGSAESTKHLETALSSAVPDSWTYKHFKHTEEGPEDMPGHVKSSILGASLTVPVSEGKICLGKDEVAGPLEILLCEHRSAGGWGGGGERTVVITLVGKGV